MCYAAPGPRCLSHATPKLDEKKLKHEKMKANYEAATAALNAIPEGQDARKEQRAWEKAADAYQRSEAELADAQAAYDDAAQYDPKHIDHLINLGRSVRDRINDDAFALYREGRIEESLAVHKHYEEQYKQATEWLYEGERLKAERQARIDESNALKAERDASAAESGETAALAPTSPTMDLSHLDAKALGDLAYETTDPNVLSAIADHVEGVYYQGQEGQKRLIATREAMSREDIETLTLIAKSRYASTEALGKVLSKGELSDPIHNRIVQKVLEHPNLSADQADKIANETAFEGTAQMVMYAPVTRPSTLSMLARDPNLSGQARMHVLGNPNTPSEDIAYLYAEPKKGYWGATNWKQWMLDHENTPAEIKQALQAEANA